VDGLACGTRRHDARPRDDPRFRALKFSANAALEELTDTTGNGDHDHSEPVKKFEITGWMAGLNMAFSIAFFIFMYKYLPCWPPRIQRVNSGCGQQGQIFVHEMKKAMEKAISSPPSSR